MSRHEQLAALLLVVMVVCAIAIALWTRRLYKEFAATPRVQWRAGRGWLHPVGCFVFWLVPVPLVALVPPLALLPSLAFLVLAGRTFSRPGPSNRQIAGVLGLCSFVWLAYWEYEAQLLVWEGTVAGAPIRVDFMLTAPLLYFVSVVGFTLGMAPQPLGESGGGPDDSQASPSA